MRPPRDLWTVTVHANPDFSDDDVYQTIHATEASARADQADTIGEWIADEAEYAAMDADDFDTYRDGKACVVVGTANIAGLHGLYHDNGWACFCGHEFTGDALEAFRSHADTAGA